MLSIATLFVKLRHRIAELVQTRFGFLLGFLGRFKLTRQTRQARFVGGVQCIAVGAELFAPKRQRARLLLNIALVSGQHLDLLLHLRHACALLVGLGLRTAQGFFKRRQLALLVFALGSQQFSLFFSLSRLARQIVSFNRCIMLARGPLRGLLGQLLQTLLDANAAIDHKSDFSFQPADFSAGFIKFALRLVDMVAG